MRVFFFRFRLSRPVSKLQEYIAFTEVAVVEVVYSCKMQGVKHFRGPQI